MDFSDLANELLISRETRQLLKNLSRISDVETIGETLTSHMVNEEYLLAARLYMHASLFGTPKNIEDYAESLSHRLSKSVYEFLKTYSEEIDDYYNQVHDPKYKYVRDFIAAKKWIKSNLLDAGFGNYVIECPEFQAVRVMTQLYRNYQDKKITDPNYVISKVLAKSEEMFHQYYTHASPTLFNSGTKYPQLGSCFQVKIYDNTKSLMQRGVADVAEISKNNGGLGIDCNDIRHSAISFSGESKGAVPFIRIYDRVLGCIDQGGRRNGAGTIYLRDWHIDVEDFIKGLPSDASPDIAIQNIQGCIWMSDLFYQRLKNNQLWTFFCPHQCPDMKSSYNSDFEQKYLAYEKLAEERDQEFSILKKQLTELQNQLFKLSESCKEERRELIQRISQQKKLIVEFNRYKLIKYRKTPARKFMELITNIQIHDGPYMMNGDCINRKSQVDNIGPIDSSNLCTEIVQHASENEIPTCNLGALNLPKYVRGQVENYLEEREEVMISEICQSYDFDLLSEKVRSLTENINYVIDENFYPLDHWNDETQKMEGPISSTNRRNRPLGIGVSGLYNAETGMGFGFDSKLGFQFNKMAFACMYFNALVESLRLAIKDGEYETFRTGTCQVYLENHLQTFSGSPLSNGFFQFDLWKCEYDYLKNIGRLVEYEEYEDDEGNIVRDEVYQLKNILPLSPSVWGQKPVKISEINPCGKMIDVEVQPTWECLRELIMKYGVRNSLLIAPMPTASTANIVSAVEAFEAPTGLIYGKRIKDVNDIYVVPEFLTEIKKLGIFDTDMYQFIASSQGSIQDLHLFCKKFYPEKSFDWDGIRRLQSIFKTAYEISQRDTARLCQQRGIYIDQSQSYNVFLAAPTVEILTEFHTFAIDLGLKTGMYYLRQLPPIPPFPISFKPEIAIYARQLLENNRKHLNSDDAEQISSEQEIFCTKDKDCISCSV